MYIGLNAVGKGFFLVHPGFVRIDSWVHIGENYTVLPMVLFGRAHPIEGTEIFVGDNLLCRNWCNDSRANKNW